jgi:hypothetical protein
MHFKDKRILTLQTTDEMMDILESKGNPLQLYKKGARITVYNKMEKDYSYVLQEDAGKNLAFKPHYTPAQMLSMGVFQGKYLNDCLLEFPKEWFVKAIKKNKLAPGLPDTSINCFKVASRLSRSEWKSYGWLPGGAPAKQHAILSDARKNKDIRGWFQWYCRYWIGRREPELDTVQIKRYYAYQRQVTPIVNHCKAGDLSCRPVQRQSLLQWAHDPFI